MKTIVSAKISNVEYEQDELDYVLVNEITISAYLWIYGDKLTSTQIFYKSVHFDIPEVGDIVLVEFSE